MVAVIVDGESSVPCVGYPLYYLNARFFVSLPIPTKVLGFERVVMGPEKSILYG